MRRLYVGMSVGLISCVQTLMRQAITSEKQLAVCSWQYAVGNNNLLTNCQLKHLNTYALKHISQLKNILNSKTYKLSNLKTY